MPIQDMCQNCPKPFQDLRRRKQLKIPGNLENNVNFIRYILAIFNIQFILYFNNNLEYDWLYQIIIQRNSIPLLTTRKQNGCMISLRILCLPRLIFRSFALLPKQEFTYSISTHIHMLSGKNFTSSLKLHYE